MKYPRRESILSIPLRIKLVLTSSPRTRASAVFAKVTSICIIIALVPIAFPTSEQAMLLIRSCFRE